MPTMKYISKNWTDYSDSKNLYDMNQMELKAEIAVQLDKRHVLCVELDEHNVKYKNESIVLNEETEKLTEPMEKLIAERKVVRKELVVCPLTGDRRDDFQKRMDVFMCNKRVFDEQDRKVSKHKKRHKLYMTQWNKDLNKVDDCLKAMSRRMKDDNIK